MFSQKLIVSSLQPSMLSSMQLIRLLAVDRRQELEELKTRERDRVDEIAGVGEIYQDLEAERGNLLEQLSYSREEVRHIEESLREHDDDIAAVRFKMETMKNGLDAVRDDMSEKVALCKELKIILDEEEWKKELIQRLPPKLLELFQEKELEQEQEDEEVKEEQETKKEEEEEEGKQESEKDGGENAENNNKKKKKKQEEEGEEGEEDHNSSSSSSSEDMKLNQRAENAIRSARAERKKKQEQEERANRYSLLLQNNNNTTSATTTTTEEEGGGSGSNLSLKEYQLEVERQKKAAEAYASSQILNAEALIHKLKQQVRVQSHKVKVLTEINEKSGVKYAHLRAKYDSCRMVLDGFRTSARETDFLTQTGVLEQLRDLRDDYKALYLKHYRKVPPVFPEPPRYDPEKDSNASAQRERAAATSGSLREEIENYQLQLRELAMRAVDYRSRVTSQQQAMEAMETKLMFREDVQVNGEFQNALKLQTLDAQMQHVIHHSKIQDPVALKERISNLQENIENYKMVTKSQEEEIRQLKEKLAVAESLRRVEVETENVAVMAIPEPTSNLDVYDVLRKTSYEMSSSGKFPIEIKTLIQEDEEEQAEEEENDNNEKKQEGREQEEEEERKKNKRKLAQEEAERVMRNKACFAFLKSMTQVVDVIQYSDSMEKAVIEVEGWATSNSDSLIFASSENKRRRKNITNNNRNSSSSSSTAAAAASGEEYYSDSDNSEDDGDDEDGEGKKKTKNDPSSRTFLTSTSIASSSSSSSPENSSQKVLVPKDPNELLEHLDDDEITALVAAHRERRNVTFSDAEASPRTPTPPVERLNAAINTEPPPLQIDVKIGTEPPRVRAVSTNTRIFELRDTAVSTNPPPTREIACQVILPKRDVCLQVKREPPRMDLSVQVKIVEPTANATTETKDLILFCDGGMQTDPPAPPPKVPVSEKGLQVFVPVLEEMEVQTEPVDIRPIRRSNLLQIVAAAAASIENAESSTSSSPLTSPTSTSLTPPATSITAAASAQPPQSPLASSLVIAAAATATSSPKTTLLGLNDTNKKNTISASSFRIINSLAIAASSPHDVLLEGETSSLSSSRSRSSSNNSSRGKKKKNKNSTKGIEVETQTENTNPLLLSSLLADSNNNGENNTNNLKNVPTSHMHETDSQNSRTSNPTAGGGGGSRSRPASSPSGLIRHPFSSSRPGSADVLIMNPHKAPLLTHSGRQLQQSSAEDESLFLSGKKDSFIVDTPDEKFSRPNSSSILAPTATTAALGTMKKKKKDKKDEGEADNNNSSDNEEDNDDDDDDERNKKKKKKVMKKSTLDDQMREAIEKEKQQLRELTSSIQQETESFILGTATTSLLTSGEEEDDDEFMNSSSSNNHLLSGSSRQEQKAKARAYQQKLLLEQQREKERRIEESVYLRLRLTQNALTAAEKRSLTAVERYQLLRQALASVFSVIPKEVTDHELVGMTNELYDKFNGKAAAAAHAADFVARIRKRAGVGVVSNLRDRFKKAVVDASKYKSFGDYVSEYQERAADLPDPGFSLLYRSMGRQLPLQAGGGEVRTPSPHCRDVETAENFCSWMSASKVLESGGFDVVRQMRRNK